MRETGTARHVGLYERTPNPVGSTLAEVNAHWTHTEGKMTYERREFVMNASRAEIISILKARRTECYQDIANLIERSCWFAPESASDKINALGTPYWINPLAPGESDAVGGFNGTTVVFGDGSTSTIVGGIDKSLAENRRFRNYAATRGAFGVGVLEQLRRMAGRLDFMGPQVVRKENGSMVPIWGWYSNQDDADGYESMVNSGPDDKKGDFSPFNGQLAFKRIPWYRVPALDELVYEPIYLLNHAHFFPYVLRDEWMKEDDPVREPNARNTFTVGVDCSWQLFCTNVRSGGGVLHRPIAA